MKAEGQRLVIHNLSEGTSWQQLKDLFKPFGPVLRSDVQSRDGVLVGYVVVEKSNAGKALAALNGSDLNGSQLSIAFDDGTTPVSTGASVYIGNVCFCAASHFEI